ncbi:MAG: NAD(P)-binding domain-containing protein [Pseudomonadota bacterium]|nr:NAD(P)-binding domain-containing protein [Pseudomonadota bacterium]
MAKLAFIGLGNTGYPMVGHFACAGHAVTTYNRSGEKAEVWITENRGESVFTCVGNDDNMRVAVLDEAGKLTGMAGDAILVDQFFQEVQTMRAAVVGIPPTRFGG